MIGLCQVSYAQLRKEPSHASELISQIIFGEWVLILAAKEDWIFIETEHGYQGFTRKAQFEIIEKEVAKAALENSSLQIWPASGKPFEFIFGMCIPGSFLCDFFAVPWGFRNWVWEEIPQSIDKPKPFLPKELIGLKNLFLGIPYVWGGKTKVGLDCSGLVQILFQQLGYSFPRDAWQQAEIGDSVPFDPGKPEFEPGDLLYFQRPGKRIHHVAISLGGSKYLHASEWTRENDLNPKTALFVQDRYETLVLAKRVQLKHVNTLKSKFLELIFKA